MAPIKPAYTEVRQVTFTYKTAIPSMRTRPDPEQPAIALREPRAFRYKRLSMPRDFPFDAMGWCLHFSVAVAHRLGWKVRPLRVRAVLCSRSVSALPLTVHANLAGHLAGCHQQLL